MSLDLCIPQLIESGQLSRERAAEVKASFEDLRETYRRDFGEATADALASEDAVKSIEVDAAERKRQTLLQVAAQETIDRDIARYDGSTGAAMIATLDHDGAAPYGNVSILIESIRGRAHSMLDSILTTFDRNLIGNMRNKAEMPDVVRELFGEGSGKPAAKQMAEAWAKTAETLRERFNQAGGHIAKLDRWGLPQSHDMLAVRNAGLGAWKRFITPMLDRERMIDWKTNKPLSDGALDNLLDQAFAKISTDGWITREAGGQGGGKLGNQRAEHRFLQFADADGWLAYHDKFGGGGTVFDAMIEHIDGMARDIAHMERLGPNPSSTLKWMQDRIEQEAALTGEDKKWFGSPAGQARALGKLYDMTSGASSIPVNAKWANALGGLRTVITSAKLGSALWSSADDVGKQAIARVYNALPVMGAVTDYARWTKAAIARDGNAKAAIRLGLIASEAGRKGAALARFTGESMGPGIANRLADGVLRASGLNAWTQAGKWAFGMEFLGHLADEGSKKLGDLHPRMQRSLERYGIDATDWDVIRHSQRFDHEGADFIDPMAIDQKAGDKLMQMVLTETSYAVPEVSNRARAMVNLGEPGTLGGELGRSMFQFKGFAVSQMLSQGRRAAGLKGWERAGYTAAYFGTTMALGAFAMQMKSVTRGQDPEPMDDWKFWARAELQGGGLGIFGDFIGTAASQALTSASGSQRVGSIGELMAGPLTGAVADAARFGFAPMDKKGSEAVRLIRGYTPGSSLWFLRTAFDREVIDSLQRWVDPHYDQHQALLNAAAKSKSQPYFWKPGDALPGRAPDLGHMFDAPHHKGDPE